MILMYSAGISAVKYGGASAGRSGNVPIILGSVVSMGGEVSGNGGLSVSNAEVKRERLSGLPHCNR